MDYMKKCFRKSSNIVERVIDDEVIIVPISSTAASQGAIYNLDQTGAKIWQWIDGRRQVSNIKEQIVGTMDVSSEQAEKDLINFLKDLENAAAIEEVKDR